MTAAVVLAAGPGTRLGELGARIPKTMIPVAGRPYLEHLATRLTDAGLRPVVVAVHHLAEVIYDHFAGWPEVHVVTAPQKGTAADLLDCLTDVPSETFMVWNGDTIVDVDIASLLAYQAEDPDRGVIVLTRCAGAPNEGAFYVADDGLVLASQEADPPQPIPSTFGWRGSSTGILALTKRLLERFMSHPPASLETSVIPALISEGKLSSWDNGTRYFLDFGTPARLAQLPDHPFGP